MLKWLPLVALVLAGCKPSEPRVVVYCAQDKEFAEDLFNAAPHDVRVRVDAKFDTEANKSVSLALELQQEAQRPRCDVHWNNEILATIRLARQGIYEPYDAPASAPYPAWTKAKDRTWQAFASRARVLIINTNLVAEKDYPKSLLDLTNPKWHGKIALAKPQFGTTATQAACLFEVLGPDAAKAYYRGLKANGVTLVPGNKQAAREVSAGRFAIGLTDTDDALIEIMQQQPVAIVFPDREGHAQHPRMGVLYIPNTLALIKNGPNPEAAKKLINYLLQQEAKLAEAGGYQIPLNPDVKAKLPLQLATPKDAKAMAVDFEKAADLWDEAQAFLRDEFAR